MAESIFARVSRLLMATVEDTVDRMEQAGGEAVMREAIREADRAIDQVKDELQSTMARRLQAARQQRMLTERAEELTTKAKFALSEGREDLAEAALSRQVDFEAQAKELDGVQLQAREAEQRLESGLAALSARKRQMEDALQAYLIARQEAALGGDGPARPDRAAEKQLDAAEQAFNRAMARGGGIGLARADADAINRVAELDGLQRSATIAERMAALKAQQAA
jgi:phage shock protein A